MVADLRDNPPVHAKLSRRCYVPKSISATAVYLTYTKTKQPSSGTQDSREEMTEENSLSTFPMSLAMVSDLRDTLPVRAKLSGRCFVSITISATRLSCSDSFVDWAKA